MSRWNDIAGLRKIQRKLLEEFAKVCNEHGLKWYAFFGTLLGIMRCEGFLPWDDDVDVAMPEEDYITLCQHKEWFGDIYFLQTPIDRGLPNFAKLRKNGTTAFRTELTECLSQGGHHGIPIDIIPLVEIPGSGCYHTPSLRSMEKLDAIYLKSWFEPAGSGSFEGLSVRIPANPRKILNEVYEDWAWPHGAMDVRPCHWFFDAEKGYEEYVRRYTGMLDNIADKKLVFFGASDSLRIWLERFGRCDQVVCTFDNDSGKWGKQAYGVEVRDPAGLKDVLDPDTRLIIVSLWHREIGKQLERMGITDYYVYLDDYYDEKIGNKVVRREDTDAGDLTFPKWEGAG